MHNNDEIILQQNFKGINTNLNGIETIKKQMEKCIYKIKKEQVHGSGFFAKIEKKRQKMPMY